MKGKILLLSSLITVLLLAGCYRKQFTINSGMITSYSVETTTEVERTALAKDFQSFLSKSGMKPDLAAVVPEGGFKGDGDDTVTWGFPNEPISISVTTNEDSKYLRGDLSWNFRGSDKEWQKFETQVERFQESVVEWFEARPEVLKAESSYWDGSM